MYLALSTTHNPQRISVGPYVRTGTWYHNNCTNFSISMGGGTVPFSGGGRRNLVRQYTYDISVDPYHK